MVPIDQTTRSNIIRTRFLALIPLFLLFLSLAIALLNIHNCGSIVFCVCFYWRTSFLYYCTYSLTLLFPVRIFLCNMHTTRINKEKLAKRIETYLHTKKTSFFVGTGHQFVSHSFCNPVNYPFSQRLQRYLEPCTFGIFHNHLTFAIQETIHLYKDCNRCLIWYIRTFFVFILFISSNLESSKRSQGYLFGTRM